MVNVVIATALVLTTTTTEGLVGSIRLPGKMSLGVALLRATGVGVDLAGVGPAHLKPAMPSRRLIELGSGAGIT